MIKVALIGKMRAGKDAFAKYFIENGYKEFKFGTGIAEIIQKYFPEEWAKGKPRRHYQHIGQQLRVLDNDVWVKYCFNQIEEYRKYMEFNLFDCKVIITDTRQRNEVEKLRAAGYIIIKVEADEKIRLERMKAAGDILPDDDYQLYQLLNHDTEQYADLVVPDILVKNEGTLGDLRKSAEAVMRQIEANNK